MIEVTAIMVDISLTFFINPTAIVGLFRRYNDISSDKRVYTGDKRVYTIVLSAPVIGGWKGEQIAGLTTFIDVSQADGEKIIEYMRGGQ